MVVLNADGPQRVIVWNTADGEQVASFETPSDIPTLDAARSSQLQLSRSGQFLLVYDRIYDIDARSINTVWKAQDHSTVYFGSGLLGDEQHIVMRLGDRYEVWDWRKNEKRMTIFLLPQKQWMVFNHETDCWNGSNFAFRHVEFLFRDANGKEEWVVPPIYEHRTGWENDPSKAGLSDLARRPPDK